MIKTIDAALQALLQEIASGGEYPDAEFRVARRYGVGQRELCQAYDAYCSGPH